MVPTTARAVWPARSAAVNPVTLALAAIGVAMAWCAVFLPAATALVLIPIIGAATFWLVFPGAALETLAVLTPFALAFDVGTMQGVRVHDGVLLVLVVAVGGSLLARPPSMVRFRTPLGKALILLWLFVTAWGTLTFLIGPANRWFLGGPVQNGWYVYRDVLRSLLPFPLAVMALGDRRAGSRVVTLLIAVATILAAWNIVLVRRTAENASFPFDSKNTLAAFLVAIIPFVVARFLGGTRVAARILCGLALFVLARALWLTGSRGGWAACAAALFVIACLTPRRRLIAAGLLGVIGLGLMVAQRGNVLQRPLVQRFFTLSRPGEVQNFTWRLEQWDHFVRLAADRPLLGQGSEVDETLRLKDRARTAHNAFLAWAVRSGLPFAAAWVALLAVLGVTSFRRARRAPRQEAVFWIGLSGAVAALAVHNMVDAALAGPHLQHLFWILAGIAVVTICEGAAPGPAAARPAATRAPERAWSV